MKFIKFTFAILLSLVVFGAQAQEKKEQKLNETLEQFRLTLIDPNESIVSSTERMKHAETCCGAFVPTLNHTGEL